MAQPPQNSKMRYIPVHPSQNRKGPGNPIPTWLGSTSARRNRGRNG